MDSDEPEDESLPHEPVPLRKRTLNDEVAPTADNTHKKFFDSLVIGDTFTVQDGHPRLKAIGQTPTGYLVFGDKIAPYTTIVYKERRMIVSNAMIRPRSLPGLAYVIKFTSEKSAANKYSGVIAEKWVHGGDEAGEDMQVDNDEAGVDMQVGKTKKSKSILVDSGLDSTLRATIRIMESGMDGPKVSRPLHHKGKIRVQLGKRTREDLTPLPTQVLPTLHTQVPMTSLPTQVHPIGDNISPSDESAQVQPIGDNIQLNPIIENCRQVLMHPIYGPVGRRYIMEMDKYAHVVVSERINQLLVVKMRLLEEDLRASAVELREEAIRKIMNGPGFKELVINRCAELIQTGAGNVELVNLPQIDVVPGLADTLSSSDKDAIAKMFEEYKCKN